MRQGSLPRRALRDKVEASESCQSGRMGSPAKRKSRVNRDRGFESPTLRQKKPPTGGIFGNTGKIVPDRGKVSQPPPFPRICITWPLASGSGPSDTG